MIRIAKRAALTVLSPVLNVAARSYIAGPRLSDALRVVRRMEARGLDTTVGPWDGPDDSPTTIADDYVAALDALPGTDRNAYLSIKLPALDYDLELLDAVVRRSREVKRRIHFDALAPETADRTWSILTTNLATSDMIGCTLPARWTRSVADAERAVELEWFVRVVKGQWEDPETPDLDPRTGFMSVIEALAGRARHVSVATHDVTLAARAVERLRKAKTSCDLELLYGLPQRASLAFAREQQVPVRIYVPYGTAYVPYVLSKALRDPRLVWWLVRDAVGGAFR